MSNGSSETGPEVEKYKQVLLLSWPTLSVTDKATPRNIVERFCKLCFMGQGTRRLWRKGDKFV